MRKWFLVNQKNKLVDQKNEKLVFGRPKKKLVDQKNVKLTGQLVDQRA